MDAPQMGMLPQPGEILDGRYELLSVLGSGSFGMVYKARQASTGQPVAVKLLMPERFAGSTQADIEVARFEREMKLIGQLRHPNVVRLVDFGRLSYNVLFLVLEFVEGMPLSAHLEKHGPMTLKRTMRLMTHVLEALSKAHELGIVHRDLKPANIMVVSGGAREHAMVLDFGLAGVSENARSGEYRALTAATQVVGTPEYMSPEQITRRGEILPQSDLYAWGLVFAECLTGTRIVSGPSPVEIVIWQASKNHHVKLPPEIKGSRLRGILSRATTKSLEARYQSAGEILADLDTLNQEVGGRRGGSEMPVMLRIAIVATLVAALVAVGAFLYAQLGTQASTPTNSAEATTVTGDADAATEDATTPACTQHRDCRGDDPEAICGAGQRCVSPFSAECKNIFGATDADDALIVAAIMSTEATPAQARHHAIELAIKEWNNAGGVRGKPLMLLSCDSKGDRTHGVHAARHAVETVGVPVIVGPGFSGIFIDVVSQVTASAGVVTMSGATTSEMVTTLPDKGLAWRTIPSDRAISESLVPLVESHQPTGLTVFAKAGPFGEGLLNTLSDSMAKKMGEHINAVAYQPGEEPERLVDAQLREGVDVVVLIGGDETIALVEKYEAAAATSGRTPRYIIVYDRVAALLDLVRRHPALSTRVEVVAHAVTDNTDLASLKRRINASFGPQSQWAKVAYFYDAMYVLAYAISAVPEDTALSGSAIASQIGRLTQGPDVRVGPQTIGAGRAALLEGSINLEGVSGPLDFDLSSGDVSGHVKLWRVVQHDEGAHYIPHGAWDGQVWTWVTPSPPATLLVPEREVVLGLARKAAKKIQKNHRRQRKILRAGKALHRVERFSQPALEVMRHAVTWADWQAHAATDTMDNTCETSLPAPGAPDDALTHVAAIEAAAFCLHLDMRLPSDREWEALAAGPEQRPYAFGDTLDDERLQALSHQTKGGTLSWNVTPEGIADLTGHVAEWVTCDEGGPKACVDGFAYRGGAAGDDPLWLRTQVYGEALEGGHRCGRHPKIGFRCVR